MIEREPILRSVIGQPSYWWEDISYWWDSQECVGYAGGFYIGNLEVRKNGKYVDSAYFTEASGEFEGK